MTMSHSQLVCQSPEYLLFPSFIPSDDLYFVTRDGALDCIQSKAMSWAINKIAGETDFDNELSDEVALEALRLRVEVGGLDRAD